jgi:serine/threonine protein kinase
MTNAITPDNWPTVSALLDEALALPAAERDTWLQSLDGERAALKDTLRELLSRASGVETEDFLATLPRFTRVTERGPLTELAAGDAIGPYRLLSELGTGGMGAVWLAERSDGQLKRKVALKLPRMIWAKGLAERMGRERDILASLEHANIARLYDAGVDQHGRPYLALEYVEGQPIDVYAKERGLSVRQKLDLLLQVCAAVAFAHSRLVVHRDLKPSNIMITADGQVRLLDFGIAKLMEGDSTKETQLTQLAGRALTLDYASPEQIKGEPIGTASDVYSLGVVAYELLTGAKPYRLKRGSAAELEEAIATADPPKASEAASEPGATKALKGDLDAILHKALKKAASQRYATVDALADDVRRHLASEPVSARPDSFVYRARSLLGRYRLQAATAAVVATALLTATIVSLEQARRAEVQRSAALAAREDALRSRQYAEEQTRLAQTRREEAEHARDRERVAAEQARRQSERAAMAADAERRAASAATLEAKRAAAAAEAARSAEARASHLNNFTLNVLARMAAEPGPASAASRASMSTAVSAELARAESVPQANPDSLAAIHGAMASVFNYLQQPELQMQAALKELEYLQRSAAPAAALAEAHRQLALAHMRHGRLDDAVAQAQLGLAVMKEPLSDRQRALAGRLHRALCRYHFLQGDMEQAVRAGAAALAQFERLPEAMLAANANHFGSAVADHVSALAARGDDLEAQRWLARIDRYFAARKDLSEADRADIEMARGRLMLESGRPQAAVEAFRAAARLYEPQFGTEGANAAVVDGLVINALGDDGRFDEARALLARWESVNVRPLLIQAARVFVGHEDHQGAEKALGQLEGDARYLARSPARAIIALALRGEWLLASGKKAAAVVQLRVAQAEAATKLPGWYREQRRISLLLMHALMNNGETAEARIVLERVCSSKASSSDPAVRSTTNSPAEARRCSDAWARIAMEENEPAIAAMRLQQTAVPRQYREQLMAELLLGRSLLALGQPDGAKAALGTARDLAARLHADSPLRGIAQARAREAGVEP